MKLLPASIHGRMLALSAFATAIALLIAAIGIGRVLERFVTQGLDQRLDAELTLLADAIDAQGRIDRTRLTAVRTLLDPGPGWHWSIRTPRESLQSGDLLDVAPPTPPDERGPHPRGPRPLDWHGENGDRIHARRISVDTASGPAELTAAAPQALVARPIRAALWPLLAVLLILGGALALATYVQLRVGLRPLRALRDHVVAIRAGNATSLPEDQPAELRPLASELNALVTDNAAALAAARASAANLAHGLKTSLATLALELRRSGRDPDGSLAPLVDRLDATIRHHLVRSRERIADTRAVTDLAPALADLATTIARLHANRDVTITCEISPALLGKIAPADLDELAGNLIDNAARHARRNVVVTAAPLDARMLAITVTDDGPGISPADRTRATDPGIRLDERGDGHGFGLAIARDLALLYGGTLTLDEAQGGGLTARVTLPRG